VLLRPWLATPLLAGPRQNAVQLSKAEFRLLAFAPIAARWRDLFVLEPDQSQRLIPLREMARMLPSRSNVPLSLLLVVLELRRLSLCRHMAKHRLGPASDGSDRMIFQRAERRVIKRVVSRS
jgi:hypothetical protein